MVDYTGAMYGYYRIEADPNEVTLPPVRAFFADPTHKPSNILLGMGNTFGPEFGAGVEWEFKDMPCYLPALKPEPGDMANPVKGGFFLRKEPLSVVLSVYTNWKTAIFSKGADRKTDQPLSSASINSIWHGKGRQSCDCLHYFAAGADVLCAGLTGSGLRTSGFTVASSTAVVPCTSEPKVALEGTR